MEDMKRNISKLAASSVSSHVFILGWVTWLNLGPLLSIVVSVTGLQVSPGFRKSSPFETELKCNADHHQWKHENRRRNSFRGRHTLTRATNKARSSLSVAIDLQTGVEDDNSNEDDEKAPNSRSNAAVFDNQLVEALDLVPLMELVAAQTGTFRGRQALLATVRSHSGTITASRSVTTKSIGSQSASSTMLSRQRRVVMAEDPSPVILRRPARAVAKLDVLATSASHARDTYQRVAEALIALQQSSIPSSPASSGQNQTNCSPQPSLSYPPLYGVDASPWDAQYPSSDRSDSDFDEWLFLSSPDQYTLEHIWQAEQVLGQLLLVSDWLYSSAVQTRLPHLAQLASVWDLPGGATEEETTESTTTTATLRQIHHRLVGAVEIVRVRSWSDPLARSTYLFRLNESKFPELIPLRRRVQQLEKNPGPTSAGNNNAAAKVNDGESVRLELQAEEDALQRQLSQIIFKHGEIINHAMNVAAQLDIYFAKAAFMTQPDLRPTMELCIPEVESQGRIQVSGFLHPLLAIKAQAKDTIAVPIDLHLSRKDGERILVISGPNAGGKTVALKSFGLVVALCKLGIPIPCSVNPGDSPRLRVDWFDELYVSVGDGQSLVEGQSTFSAQLTTYSTILDRVLRPEGRATTSQLVLMDEMGSGTEVNAGGALAQAVLEKLHETERCCVVVTTHVPRLKALAFDDPRFRCAAVLLSQNHGQVLPSYTLQYGLIGESHPLATASRCNPPLPDDVLRRAQAIISDSEQDSCDLSYVRALADSLQLQLDAAQVARSRLEKASAEAALCQKAMWSLAAAYDRHMERLEDRLDRAFQTLRADSSLAAWQVVGDSLAGLRLVKQQIKDQETLLRERGLKMLEESYQLRPGETVVLVGGEWDGIMAQVAAQESDRTAAAPDELYVIPTMGGGWDETLGDSSSSSPEGLPLWLVKRRDVALWDYDSVWELDQKTDMEVRSIPDSKRRLHDVLASLQSTTSTTSSVARPSRTTNSPKFTSARARKSAQRQAKKSRK